MGFTQTTTSNGKPMGNITFSSYNLPALEDGLYQISVSHTFQAEQAGSSPAIPPQSRYFTVLGPRFTLDPNEIAIQFPPPKTNGMYYDVLPHVIFNRSILPWERRLDESLPQTPWLAMVCITQNETQSWQAVAGNEDILKIRTGTLTDICNDAALKNIVFPLLSDIQLYPGESATETLNYIDIPETLLQLVLPEKDELPLLAGVRQSADVAPDGAENPKFPVLMCNRLPQPGQENTVFLLSLEQRTDVYDLLAALNPLTGIPTPVASPKLYRFAVLNTWQFASVTPNLTFTQLLTDADMVSSSTAGAFRLPSVGNAEVDAFLEKGYVHLPHQTRQGNNMVSWYRGPFLPGVATAAIAPNPSTVVSADMLVNIHSEIGMFEISYASAWNLGRNMMLENRRISQALFEWKRACTQALKANTPSHLPFTPLAIPQLPAVVLNWFQKMILLDGVSFNYLVPDSNLSPAESIQFFSVDQMWIQYLLLGAFAVGDIASADEDIEDQLFKSIPQPISLTGFILNSTVVAGWPQLLVNGFDDSPPQGTNPPFESGLTPLSQHRYTLGKNTLLCIFEGSIQSVEIYLHPETIHYGVTYTAPDPSHGIPAACYIKYLRDEQGNPVEPSTTACSTQTTTDFEVNQWVRVPFRLADCGIIDIDSLSNLLIQAIPNIQMSPAEFAYQMVEGVPKVRFTVKS